MRFQNLQVGKSGPYLTLEVFGAGEARCMRGGFVIAAHGPADAADEFLEPRLSCRQIRNRNPGLIIARTSGVEDDLWLRRIRMRNRVRKGGGI